MARGAPRPPAEVSQKQGVRVTVDGSLSPKLPRKGSAPIAVSVKGQIQPGGASAYPSCKS